MKVFSSRRLITRSPKPFAINFDVDLSSKIVVDVIDLQMGRSFKTHRAKLQELFFKMPWPGGHGKSHRNEAN
ncbi:hypothetical protein Ccrd_008453 [Cynara cardunculus var. scolymus]|uniref:Uncharacterized protein n=1 Tax=Cynara cardunculus var. scolymus TaxID=59895 RepID=A0A103XF44_CYNCS|nr:hypothetical protein Ccrd_008453 [Cynara cardunculus var. scolymus]